MDEAQARLCLEAAQKPADAWQWAAEFQPDPRDAESDLVTVRFSAGTDCLSAEVTCWSWKDDVKLRFPIDDPTGREVITRHVGSSGAIGLVPPGTVLLHRFVLYANGHSSRFDNSPTDIIRAMPTAEQKEAWKQLAKDFAGRGHGTYECVGDLVELAESVLVHPGPYPETIEVAFFTSAPERVRFFSWDTKRRRAALLHLGRTRPATLMKVTDAALIEAWSFSRSTFGGPPPVGTLELRKVERLLPGRA